MTSARTSMRCPPRSGCSDPKGWARSSWPPRRSSELRPGPRRLVQLRAGRRGRPRRLVARRPPLRGHRLPSPVGRRDGPLDRLAVDVRRARLRLPAGTRGGRGDGRAAGRRSPASTVLTPLDRMGTLRHVPDRRLAGPDGARRARRRGCSRSPGRSTASMRCGSASASSRRTRSSSGSRGRSSCSPRTRQRRSRRAGR